MDYPGAVWHPSMDLWRYKAILSPIWSFQVAAWHQRLILLQSPIESSLLSKHEYKASPIQVNRFYSKSRGKALHHAQAPQVFLKPCYVDTCTSAWNCMNAQILQNPRFKIERKGVMYVCAHTQKLLCSYTNKSWHSILCPQAIMKLSYWASKLVNRTTGLWDLEAATIGVMTPYNPIFRTFESFYIWKLERTHTPK